MLEVRTCTRCNPRQMFYYYYSFNCSLCYFLDETLFTIHNCIWTNSTQTWNQITSLLRWTIYQHALYKYDIWHVPNDKFWPAIIENKNVPHSAWSNAYIWPTIRRKNNTAWQINTRTNKTCRTLREISGAYWLTWVSLAIVSRRPRIIKSIDPTVANFQVNDPNLCEIHGDENHNLPFSLLLNLLYYTIEKCRFKSPLWHCFFMEICLIFYSYYIVMRAYIYTMLAMYVLYVLV